MTHSAANDMMILAMLSSQLRGWGLEQEVEQDQDRYWLDLSN